MRTRLNRVKGIFRKLSRILSRTCLCNKHLEIVLIMMKRMPDTENKIVRNNKNLMGKSFMSKVL